MLPPKLCHVEFSVTTRWIVVIFWDMLDYMNMKFKTQRLAQARQVLYKRFLSTHTHWTNCSFFNSIIDMDKKFFKKV